MVSASFEWRTPPSVMIQRLEDYEKRLILAVHALGKFFAAKMQTYAAKNARWTDRTGNARQGLTGVAVELATGVIIYLFHKMSYGLWLEVAFAGKYAIVLETMETHYGQIMSLLRKMMK